MSAVKPVMYGRADGATVCITRDQWDRGNEFRKDIQVKVQREFCRPLYGQNAIDQLTAERDVLAKRLEKLEALLRKPDVGIFEALDHHGPAEGLLEFDEGLWYTPEGSYLDLDDALEALVP